MASFNNIPAIAYFSMEIALDGGIPTYSGGLGILAGDNLRAAADLSVPIVGMTLLYRKGYFVQHLDAEGNQSETDADWAPEKHLQLLPTRVTVEVEGREVIIQVWRYILTGISKKEVPVYFLDTGLTENTPYDRTLTERLYGGDSRYRLCQEVLLGVGGVRMLHALGHDDISTYHMNEGHSALLAIELLEQVTNDRGLRSATSEDKEVVRQQCVFTTHTPVPAGQDRFPRSLVHRVLGEEKSAALESIGTFWQGMLNMTHLGLMFSRYINGVSMRHEEISRDMFPGYPINSVTNGVHAVTWTSPSFCRLYDKHVPEWRRDTLNLRYAISIPLNEILQAHVETKQELLKEVQRRSGVQFEMNIMTIGFARRATLYKRADLLFSDISRLKRVVERAGPLQIIYGGKAHPEDEGGKEMIRRVFRAAGELRDSIKVVYLEEYDMALAKYLDAGTDLWLNTPKKPEEASGTSGMKAAMNGVPSLSVLDGWWVEGLVEGVTGWAIGDSWQPESNPENEITSLYDKLEYVILPMYYHRSLEYAAIMRASIALNGSFYNAQRMVFQYLENAYIP